ncbi:class II fumarate hydratase [Rhabdothermincola salaria]|uniref:class II fumarate hydratase n=1 Tax=Rhabdothermincola salaria TaxID=2903142 RepID=UPI001E4D0CC6|nr:class II fumarate hydratase [Rhabdothermincola salaria]MCD9623460.1 class II fumarate hydratase [Rhabdothermincola salaria]
MSDETRLPETGDSPGDDLPDRPTHRVEHDSMGEVLVPAGALYRAQTQRAVENFPISGQPIDRALIRALALVKGAAGPVNASLRDVPAVDRRMGEAIAAAADEVAEGRWDDEFPVDVFQTGSGTSSNMNANEVIATLASQHLGGAAEVHPNDHVNASQSSNDVFPSAVHLAASEAIAFELIPALTQLEASLRRRARRFRTVVKSGRTHLMDATPVTLGQEFGGYATQVEQCVARLHDVLPRLGELPLGGTAVGTGINAPRRFAPKVIETLRERTGLPLSEASDHFASQGARDALVEASGQLRVAAVALTKIANDVRWMASGPRTGLAEIRLPDLQPGSSIMPGKVNPVLPEAVTQVAAQVIGNDAAVAFGGSQGNFELNVYMPMMARNVLESIRLLANVSRLFAERCIDGIEADEERCRDYAESSPSLGTSLNPFIGYEAAAELVKVSVSTGRSIRELALETGLMTEEELDRALDVLSMTKGGVQR